MKLEKEPRIEEGPSFMFSLKSILRNIATVVNEALSTVTGGTLAGNLSISKASPILNMTATSGDANVLFNGPPGTASNLTSYRGSNPRWQIALTNNEAETGSNAGSNFGINRFSDAGAYLGSVLYIRRSDGSMTVGDLTTNRMAYNAQLGITGNGSVTEGGGNIQAAGLFISPAFPTNFQAYHVPGNWAGFRMIIGSTSPGVIEFRNNATIWCNGVQLTSDMRLKEAVEYLDPADALAQVLAIPVISFARVDEPAHVSLEYGPTLPQPKPRYIGVPAQVVKAIRPELVSSAPSGNLPDKLSMDYGGLGALALCAVHGLHDQLAPLIAAQQAQAQLIAELREEIELLKGA